MNTHAPESPFDIPVDRAERVRSISSAEVLTPSTQHGIELGDYHARIFVTALLRGHVLHALSDPLHALRRRLALQEVNAPSRAFPNRPGELLLQMTAEEVDSLLAPAEVDSLRLF